MPTLKNTLLAVVFWAMFLAGWLWPDQWWATHSLAFLPVHAGYLWLVVSLAMILWWRPVAVAVDKAAVQLCALPKAVLYLALLVCAGASAWATQRWPIAHDIVGDAMRLAYFFTQDDQFKPGYLQALLDWRLFYWQNGERTVLNGMHLLSHSVDISPRDAFSLLGTVCLSLYVLMTGLFVATVKASPLQKFTLLCLWWLAAFLWQFFGHMEIYAPAILLISLYVILLYRFFSMPGIWRLLGLWLAGYCCVRVHTGHALIVVSLLAATLYQWWRDTPWFRRWFSLRGVLLLVLLPTAAGGLYLYFIVFQDHIDPRTAAPLKEQIFLPLFSPMPPLDRYNLFSSAHVFDYLTHVLMLSAAGVYVVMACGLTRFGRTPWQQPAILVLGTTLLLYLIFFAVMNPLLGMPLDIDLFAISGPVLVMFACALVLTLDEKAWQAQMAVFVLVFSLFTPAIVATNTQPKWMADKAVSLGARTFRTYWMGGMAPVLAVMHTYTGSEDQFEAFVDDFRARVDPWVSPYRDIEYAEFMKRTADVYLSAFDRPATAETYYRRAYQADAGDPDAALALMKQRFAAGDFDQALALSQHLMMVGYPEPRRASRMAIHCALMAGDYGTAGMLIEAHTERFTDDGFIRQVQARFRAGEREVLRDAFGE